MIIASLLFMLGLATTPVASTSTQTCLHTDDTNPQQAARRRAAIALIRLINTIEAREHASGRPYGALDTIAASDYYLAQRTARQDTPDLNLLLTSASGWTVRLDVFQGGYWLSLSDATDACGLTYITNQEGVIFRSEPLQ